MAALRNGVFQANAQSLAGDSDVRVASTFKSLGIEFGGATQRASDKGLPPGFYRRLFAVSVASLILVFVLLRCFQYVSFVPKVAAGNRSLASGGSDGDFCPNWPGNEEIEEGNADGKKDQGVSGAAGLPVAAGVAQLPSAQEGEAGSFQESAENGWESEEMPPQWMGRAAGLLHALKTLPSTFKILFPLLEPSEAVYLCERLLLIGVVELASMAYVPSALQPMRFEAAEAFTSIFQQVQSNEATWKAARQIRLHRRLAKLNKLFYEIGAAPPKNVGFQDYKATMTSCLNTASYTITQVSAQMQFLLDLHQEQGTLDVHTLHKVIRVLRAIYDTRRTQLLRARPLREWLSACQVAINASIIHAKKPPQEDANNLEQQPLLQVDEVHNAIVEAEGTPATSALTSLDVDHEPLPADPGQSEAPHQPSGPGQPLASLQPQEQGQALQPDLLPALHPPDAADDPSHWAQLGARPRQQLAPVAQPRAQQLGWGYRQIPDQWSARFRELLELMRRPAITCGSVLPLLPPRQAVLLSVYLSTFAAVQIAAFAYLPADLQPLRQALGASYGQLLEKVLTTKPMRAAAADEGLIRRIESLRLALGRLSGAPPDVQIAVNEYMRRMCIYHRVYKFANLQVVTLLEELISSQPPSSDMPVKAEAIIKALAPWVPALKMHLLVDKLVRDWFVSQTRDLAYPSCTQEDLEKASQRSNLSTRTFVRRLQILVVKAGLTPIALEKEDSPFDNEPKSMETTVGEQSTGDLMGPSLQDSQGQPAPTAPHSLSAPLESEHHPSQPSYTPSFSSQPPAQPAPPPWSAVPTPPFGLHHSPWTWSSADQKQSKHQHAQASSVWPPFVSSAYSSEPTDGGVSDSWDEGQVEESSGAAAGDLGLQDLAERVAEWALPGAEDAEGQGSSGDGHGDLGLLDLAQRVLKWDASDTKKDEEDD
ncbi:hypothetical protein Emed_001378 [Eimeria media]